MTLIWVDTYITLRMRALLLHVIRNRQQNSHLIVVITSIDRNRMERMGRHRCEHLSSGSDPSHNWWQVAATGIRSAPLLSWPSSQRRKQPVRRATAATRDTCMSAVSIRLTHGEDTRQVTDTYEADSFLFLGTSAASSMAIGAVETMSQ